jgi:hypothetical protein
LAKSDRIKGVKGTPYDKPLFVLIFALETRFIRTSLNLEPSHWHYWIYQECAGAEDFAQTLKEYNEKVT